MAPPPEIFGLFIAESQCSVIFCSASILVLCAELLHTGHMEVSWGQEPAGLWSGEVEAWLSWRYAYPRRVAAACFLPNSSGLNGIHFHLAACVPGQDNFSPVAVQLTPAQLPGMQPGTIMTVQVIPITIAPRQKIKH